jgi:hypothetical protein
MHLGHYFIVNDGLQELTTEGTEAHGGSCVSLCPLWLVYFGAGAIAPAVGCLAMIKSLTLS